MTEQERQLVQMLRDDAGPIRPNGFLDAADVIERLAAEVERLRAGGCARDQSTTQYCAEAVRIQAERDAFKAQADDVVEVDIDDVERVIKAAKSLGKDSIRLSARDIWRMANDKRGREEEDQPWN